MLKPTGKQKKLVVGITGASGVVYGVRLLTLLRNLHIETHLILSEGAKKNILIETDYCIEAVEELADVVHDDRDLGAPVSSGSFRTQGMVIVPCTIKTLSGVANSYNDNLIVRAADVTLKESRKLILVVRETPLHKGHLKLMHQVADLGGVILPPVPAFYIRPKRIEDLIDHTLGKVFDLLGIQNSLYARWKGNLGGRR
ncbi:MAG: UbiX family flavin prenyltransferase [Syntrophorhabdus sp.]